MGIMKAAGKAQASQKTSDQEGSSSTESAAPPLSNYKERSASLKLYVKDKELLREVKRAAFDQDTSLSALWEEWATEWLKTQP